MNKKVQTYVLQIVLAVVLSAAYYFTLIEEVILQTALFAFGSGLAIALLFFDESVFSKKYAERGVENQVVMTRSLLFVLTLFPLGIFVTTSSGSSLGMGLILVLLGGLLVEMMMLRKQVHEFNSRFVSQLKEPWKQETIYKYIAGIGFFWLFLVAKMFIV